MDRETLIDTLSRDVGCVQRHAVGRRIALGMLAGGAVTILLIGMTIGFNPDLSGAVMRYHFWLKWAYCLSVGSLAIGAVRHLARPDSRTPRILGWLALPMLGLAGVGIAEMCRVPPSHWLAMWLGESWMVCPWLVLTAAMPIFIGLLWSFRRFAPTRLREAGAAAGLAAGAIGAMLYCLHCPEVSAIFVLTWYTLGILLATGIGAVLGPHVLRW